MNKAISLLLASTTASALKLKDLNSLIETPLVHDALSQVGMGSVSFDVSATVSKYGYQPAGSNRLSDPAGKMSGGSTTESPSNWMSSSCTDRAKLTAIDYSMDNGRTDGLRLHWTSGSKDFGFINSASSSNKDT